MSARGVISESFLTEQHHRSSAAMPLAGSQSGLFTHGHGQMFLFFLSELKSGHECKNASIIHLPNEQPVV